MDLIYLYQYDLDDANTSTARNMQSPSYNKKYASSLPALKTQLPKVSNDPAALLDLLRNDETYDFGSGAWFLTTQCSSEVRKQLQSGSESGWQMYISDCVGTSVTDERKQYWEKAVKALGVGGGNVDGVEGSSC